MRKKNDLKLTDLSPGLRSAVVRFDAAIRRHDRSGSLPAEEQDAADAWFYGERQTFLRKLVRTEQGIKMHKGGGRHSNRNTSHESSRVGREA